MKKSYFLGLKVFMVTMLSVMYANAQDSQGIPHAQYIPNVFMATPQQASLAKVSEIPIDITTGRMDFRIPIYEIKEKGLSLPISLSYNYSGLLLDEYAGWAGTGWVFNIGGSIVHSVNGQNDENHEGDKDGVDAYLFNKPPFDGNHGEQPYIANEASFLEGLVSGAKDGLSDKYIINIGNINCTFYIDKDGNAIFIKNEPYKLSGNSTVGFTLIDDKGIIYKFNKTVISNYHAPKNMDLSVLASVTDYDYISSFLITEIKFPDSTNSITFEYTDSTTYYQDFMLNQSLVLGYNSGAFSTIYKNPTTISTFNSYLKKITTPQETIEVYYNNSPTGLAVINNLKIKDKDNIVKNYDFNYSNWFDRRINLLGISYNGQLINEMEYDMSTPYPIPGAQNNQNNDYLKKDLWGYYNSSYNPPTDVTYNPPNNAPNALTYLNSPYNNPTVKPNYDSTKIGALTKITYATKGYSLIEYEPNKVYMTREKYNLPYDADILIHGGDKAKTSPFKEEDNIDKVITVTTPCKAVLTYDLSNNTSIALDDTYTNGTVIFYKEESSSSPLFTKTQNWNNEGNWIPKQLFFQGNMTFELTPGIYHIQSSSVKGTMANITLVTTTLPDEFDQTVGGLRIKQIKNCDFNDKCIADTYSYNNNYSSGVNLIDLQFSSGSYVVNNPCANTNASFRYYNYGSVYPLSAYRGSPVLYGVVAKSVKDDKGNANGKEVFYSEADNRSTPLNPEIAILRNGVLKKKLTFNQSDKPLEQTINTYEYSANPDANKKVYGMMVNLRRDDFSSSSNVGCIHIAHNHNSFSTSVLSHSSNNYKIKSETISQYYNNDSLVKKSNYNYNLSTGLTTSQSTTNSTGETIETKYYYPQDSEMSNKSYINELIQGNIIGIPLDTQTYKAGIKLSEQLTVYDKSVSTNNLLLPKTIYAAKFSNSLPTVLIDKNLEKKITYDLYDDKGNILQYTLESGIPVSIIWGYNKTQPIAKIENLTYNLIPSETIANLQTLSNADTDNCMSGSCTEQLLRNGLNAFRGSLPYVFISTYTYNPLVGVTSVTDPKEESTFYEYDPFGRLKFVKDKDLNILQKYCYNYKGQQTDCSDNTSTSVVLYKSIARSGPFFKDNCAPGGSVSSIAYSQAVGASTSTISQADADSKGLTKFNTDGQTNANATGICTFSSIAQSGSFFKTNCAPGGSGSSVTYSQAAGASTSTISQADADSKGLTKFNTDGQANANSTGSCTFSSIARSGSFPKINCAPGGSGSSVAYSQAVGASISTISQADADSKGLTKFNTDGQANANTTGSCTFSSISRSGPFFKTNCAPGGSGSSVTYSQAVGASTSTISQADADAIGLSKFNTDGQNYANANANCTYGSIGFNGSFAKNNCEAGGVGSSVPFSQAAGAVTSTVSQADANTRGLDKFNTEGHTNANSNSSATCTFYNAAKSITANKNNCGTGKGGSAVTYTVPAGTYSSTISQSNADLLAQNNISLNSQTYINANGTCSPETYSVSMDDYDSVMSKIWLSASCNSASHIERTISVTIRYQYQVNKTASINKYFVLPANSTYAGFTVTLTFFGEPVIQSYTIN
jgi:YD repeat-containing protein